jgi:hypothetical protein
MTLVSEIVDFSTLQIDTFVEMSLHYFSYLIVAVVDATVI